MVSTVTRCKACHGRKTIPKIGGMGMKDCPACMGVGSVKEPEKPKEETILHENHKPSLNSGLGEFKEVESKTLEEASKPEVKKEVHKHGNSVDKRKKKN